MVMTVPLQGLYDWYCRLGAGPTWCGTFVYDLKPWLSRLVLVRFPADGSDAYIAVYGAGMVTGMGRDLTGQRLSDIQSPEGVQTLVETYRMVRAARRCYTDEIAIRFADKSRWTYQRLFLPFAARNGGDDRVLCCVDVEGRSEPWRIHHSTQFECLQGRFLND